MINKQYKLTSPYVIEAFHNSINSNTSNVIVRPEKLSICKADIRYYCGMRDTKVLKQRLPLALIHEAAGIVLHDPQKNYQPGDTVILLPNIPGKDDNYDENYRLDSQFRSSKADGFMQEMISVPSSQVIPYKNIKGSSAAIVEFVSVGIHAVTSYLKRKKRTPQKVAVWGDGALGYVISCLLKYFMPDVHLTVLGVNKTKLELFQFANNRLTVDELEITGCFDDVFECVGGQASGNAINQMIDTIMPEGIITLLGVSEESVPVNTRMLLEKGLTLLGRSRSTREDFEKTIEIMEANQKFASRIGMLISEEIDINDINDIHKAFQLSKIVDYKLVLNWKI